MIPREPGPTFPQLAVAVLAIWSLLIAVFVGIYVAIPRAMEWWDDGVKCCACRLEKGGEPPCATDAMYDF